MNRNAGVGVMGDDTDAEGFGDFQGSPEYRLEG